MAQALGTRWWPDLRQGRSHVGAPSHETSDDITKIYDCLFLVYPPQDGAVHSTDF